MPPARDEIEAHGWAGEESGQLCRLCCGHHAQHCPVLVVQAPQVCGPVRSLVKQGWLMSITTLSCICTQLSTIPTTFTNLSPSHLHGASLAQRWPRPGDCAPWFRMPLRECPWVECGKQDCCVNNFVGTRSTKKKTWPQFLERQLRAQTMSGHPQDDLYSCEAQGQDEGPGFPESG